MNKVISFNRTQVGGRYAAHPVQTSILDRYMAKSAQNGGELSPDQMYKFMAGENAKVLSRRRPDETLDEKTLEECRAFAEYYVVKVSQKTKRAVADRFGGLPFFLQAGINAIPDTTFPLDLKLTEEQWQRLDSLAKYVGEMCVNRLAAFCIKDGGDNGDLFKTVALAADTSSPKMRMNKKELLICAGFMIQMGGKMTLRQYLPDGKFAIMGFTASNGELRPIPAEKLKADYQKSPKCSEADIQNITFITPSLS